jgi:peptidoglycan hydrolase-like protein with peptidoglycan-binding domain
MFFLQGCTFLVTTFEIGGAAATAGSTTTAVEVAQALDIAGTAGDAVSIKETGKTLTDHVVSFLTEKDCSLWRKLKGDGAYCEVYLPKMDTVNRIRIFQIIEGIRPVNGKMGPLTRQAYWNYEHGVREWDQKLYLKFPHTEEEVKAYQKENGITPQNGNIGPKTIKSLIKFYNDLKN